MSTIVLGGHVYGADSIFDSRHFMVERIEVIRWGRGQLPPILRRAYRVTDLYAAEMAYCIGDDADQLILSFSFLATAAVDSATYDRYLLTAISSGDYSMNSTEPLWGEWCEANRPKDTETSVDDDAENEGEVTSQKQGAATGTLPVVH